MPRGGSFLLLAVVALWITAVCAVGIGGEFPLSDDWAYAHVVRSLVAGRGFDLLPWTGASLVFQAAYGAVVTAVAGFSYETLRLSTLAVSLAGILATFGLVREAGGSARVAATGAAAVAFSPLWFNLSFTFMTDVPFAALATVSAWLYARALARGSRSSLAVAGAVCAAAFLVRQHAVWIALAAAIAAMLPLRAQDSPSPAAPLRERLVDAAAALSAPLAVAIVYAAWALTSPVAPLALHNKIGEAAGVSMLAIGNAAFRGLATLGFFVLPWTAIPAAPRARTLLATLLVLLSAAALFLYLREGATMFYLSNMLGFSWIGPWTTRDVQFLGHAAASNPGLAARALLTFASLVSAASLVARLAVPEPGAPVSDPDRRRPAMFCVLALAISAVGSLTQSHYFFDRYLIVLVPLAVAALAGFAPPRAGGVTLGALAALALYAVAGTHDYMEWNRARWNLLEGLEARGVSARSIDGGMEYNGERLAAELGTSPSDAEARRGQPESRRSWWWVVDDRWVISKGPLDGYREADARTFARWLPPGDGRVLLLERALANP